MKFRHFAVPLVCAGFLVGCGGGGGGDDGGSGGSSTPPEPTASVSIGQSTLSIDEGDQKTVEVSYEAASDVSVSVTDDAVEASLDGTVLTISASEVDRPVSLDVSVTAALEGEDASASISIYVDNTSAEALTAQVDGVLNERRNLLDLADDYRLYQFFVDFAYLGGVISQQEKASYLSEFDVESSATYVALDQQMAALAATQRDYQKGNLSDSELQSEMDQTESTLIDHSAYGKARLTDISEFSEVLVPGFTPADMAFDPESGLYSRFLSNEEFGSYLDGEYRFSESFSALTSLVRLSPSDPALCKGA